MMLRSVVESFAMRTTIDLPERDHQLFIGLARAQRTSLSKVILELARRGLRNSENRIGETSAGYSVNPATGLPMFRSGRPITIEDVKALEDES
jgi:hypothetical protein